MGGGGWVRLVERVGVVGWVVVLWGVSGWVDLMGSGGGVLEVGGCGVVMWVVVGWW